ncbi:MAG: hypothetical protein V4596_03450 [Bdellovibrionota bacterium]
MTKKTVLIILAIFCIIAIYNLKTPSNRLASSEIENEVPLVEEMIAPAETAVELVSSGQAQTGYSTGYSPATLRKISILKEILAGKNDNDPRMDTDLKNLSNEDKDALVDMYKDLKAESLNDKGTIAFLIGRELTRSEDAEFLKNILSEEPCLSLENCGVTNSQRDPHMDNVNNVTLSYPQIVALNRIKTFVQTQDLQTANSNVLNHLIDAVKIGQNSKIPMVQDRSKEIANLLTRN